MSQRVLPAPHHRFAPHRRWDDEPSYRAASARPTGPSESLWDGDELHRRATLIFDDDLGWDSGLHHPAPIARSTAPPWWWRVLPVVAASLLGALSAVVTWHLVPPVGELTVELTSDRTAEMVVLLDGTKRCDILPCTMRDVKEGMHVVTVVTTDGQQTEERMVRAGEQTVLRLGSEDAR